MSDNDLEINLGDMGPAPGTADLRFVLKGFKATARQALTAHLELIQAKVDAAIENMDIDAVVSEAIEKEIGGVITEMVQDELKAQAEHAIASNLGRLQASVSDAVDYTIKQLAPKLRGT